MNKLNKALNDYATLYFNNYLQGKLNHNLKPDDLFSSNSSTTNHNNTTDTSKNTHLYDKDYNTILLLPPVSLWQKEFFFDNRHRIKLLIGAHKIGKSNGAVAKLWHAVINHDTDKYEKSYDNVDYLYLAPSSAQVNAGHGPFKKAIDKLDNNTKDRLFAKISTVDKIYEFNNGARVVFKIITGDKDDILDGNQTQLTILDEADKLKEFDKYRKSMHSNTIRTLGNIIMMGNNSHADNNYIQFFKEAEKQPDNYHTRKITLEQTMQNKSGLVTETMQKEARKGCLTQEEYNMKYLLHDMPDLKSHIVKAYQHALIDNSRMLNKPIAWIGIDYAVLHDHTALVALNTHGNLVVCHQYPNKTSCHEVKHLILEDIYNLTKFNNDITPHIAIDATGNGLDLAQFIQHKIGEYNTHPVKFNASNKQDAFDFLINCLNSKRITIPIHNTTFQSLHNITTQYDRLELNLELLKKEFLNFGYYKNSELILKAKQGHDDTISALLTIAILINSSKTSQDFKQIKPHLKTSLTTPDWNYNNADLDEHFNFL